MSARDSIVVILRAFDAVRTMTAKEFIKLLIKHTIQWVPGSRCALYFLPTTRTLNVQHSPAWVGRIVRGVFSFLARYASWNTPIERFVTYRVNKNSFSMSLDIGEYTQCGYYFSAPNPELSSLLLRGGHLFIDVGTNVGFFTILASPYFERVIAFEPTPSTYKRLKGNVALNALSNVEMHPYALSDKTGEAVLYENPLNRGGNSLEVFSNDYIIASRKTGWISYDIATTTLDEFVKVRRLDQIDFIKLDVERHEEKVLIGAMDSLNRFFPMLFVEVDSITRYKRLKHLLPCEYRGWDPINRCEIDESHRVWNRFDVLFSTANPWRS